MLNLAIWIPLLTGLIVLTLPRSRTRLVRKIALGGSLLSLLATCILAARVALGDVAERHARCTLAWIPSLGASYDVAVDGLSLPLLLLSGVLFSGVMIDSLHKDERARSHAFLFLLMQTGLNGLFASQDLLLFYLFFELSLVPMYFVIGLFGHDERRYAAMKFFLYTRAASLFMLLSFLALYLSMSPRTFSLPAIAAQRPLAAAPSLGALTLLGLLLGFGVKLPTLPIHNWLPDAHVEAPTEGSVILAGLHLKMGGYGLIRVLLPTVPEAASRFGWLFVVLGIASIVYGAFAALGQRDFKRLVAYTSVSHMGYVMLGVGVFALSPYPAAKSLALTGATYQMVSHGLLTGGMFLLVGVLEDQTHTRDLRRFGGVLGQAPIYAALLGVLAFGSLGLPGLSGFIAEFQVIGSTLSLSLGAAALTVLGLILTTAVYLRVLGQIVMGQKPQDAPPLRDPGPRQIAVLGVLAALSLFLGLRPAPLVAWIEAGITPLSSSELGAP